MYIWAVYLVMLTEFMNTKAAASIMRSDVSSHERIYSYYFVFLKFKITRLAFLWRKSQNYSHFMSKFSLSCRNLWCTFSHWGILETSFIYLFHCVKSVRIRSFFGEYFHAYALNTERYSSIFSPNAGK